MADIKGIPGYLTVSEAEERYGIKADTLKRQCQKGKVRGAIKQGKTWFVPNIPDIDPERPISENYPTLHFDRATESNLLLYDAEDRARYILHSKFNNYVYIWEYGYYFISLIFKHPLHKSYMPLAALVTEAHTALRGAFLLNLNGYHPEAFTLLRRTHESTVKAIASKIKSLKTWNIVFSTGTQKAESIIGVEFKKIWTVESSFVHSNYIKVFEAAKNMDNDNNPGVSFGPQMDEKLFKTAANISIFWLYVLVKTLPYVFANQMGDAWISRQEDSAKLMKDYLVSSGALKGELKSFDNGISKLLKKS
ncbi:MAG: helix-turn-helix domain-containing protein [Candidatus Levybacteria bacterium]|nr:helix-turn-helix domain-containing protein [Candidatus Levybacteria bacterium]